jgi:hypothetical protein
MKRRSTRSSAHNSGTSPCSKATTFPYLALTTGKLLPGPDHLTELTAPDTREHLDLLEGLSSDGGAGFVGGVMGEG